MSNHFSDDIGFNEDLSERKNATETNLLPESLFLPLGQPKRVENFRFPLAFEIPDDLPIVLVEGYTLAWTKEALENLATIQKATLTKSKASVKNLPYTSLRGFLEIGLKNIQRIKSSVGLSRSDLNRKISSEPEAFAYVTDDEETEIKKSLRPILNDWITNFIRPFVEKEKVSLEPLERLEELQEESKLLKITPLKSQALPWSWDKQTGTTQAKDTYAYRTLADYAAREIAGKQIFDRLGSMKRIISSSVAFTSGVAELITNPIQGKFSLVVRLEVVTYPSLRQPVLKIDVSKRRWLSQLKSPDFDRNAITGFVFSQDYPDRAFGYRVISKRDNNYKEDKNNKQDAKKKSHWKTDMDFEILQRELKLPLEFDGKQIALGKASTDSCQVMLTYRNGLQDNSDEEGLEEYGIETGVPEIDKLEAIEAIGKILEPLGIKYFHSYSQVKLGKEFSHKPVDKASATRTINIFTLLGGISEALEAKFSTNFTPNFLKKLTESQMDSLLRKNFNIGLRNIHLERKSLEFDKGKRFPNQTKELKELIQANEAAMRRLYPNEKPALWIFYEDELQVEIKLLKAIAHLLWGGAIEIFSNRLPGDTHGPRDLLPGNELKTKERSRKRIEAWEPIAKQIAARKQQTFCLILARKFYPDPTGEKTTKRDDKVNKPSTRQALAAKAGACVQFLEPIAKNRNTNRFKLPNFFHRVQAALRDLLSAHSGRVDDVREKVDKYLKNISPEARPKEILAITIVRKQKGRVRGRIESTFLAVAMRLKVDTTKCELCCAYEKANRLEISPWNNFSDAIAFIAQLSPVKLADTNEVRKSRFMDFVKKIISDSVEAGAQPLIIIDSSNCVQLWPWLADIRMNAHKIDLGQQYQWMQDEWQGARIIRVRQELAPGIIEKKVRQLAQTSLEDKRSLEELKKLPPTKEIPSASSSIGLFRLSATKDTGCVAYLSVGKKAVHRKSRGPSCYRPTQTNTPVRGSEKNEDGSREKIYNKAGLAVHKLLTRPPFVDRWATPNPLEIVVTLRQPEDDPDCLALLVESLRYSFGHYSEWTALPAPLFFERVVRDYISEFAIEDEDNEGESDS